MGLASRLTDPLLVEALRRADGGLRTLRSRVAGCANHRASPEVLVAKGEDVVDTWVEAANDLGVLRHAIPRPSRHLVPDAAR
jgi:predicted RNase H-like HicB family nuclease